MARSVSAPKVEIAVMVYAKYSELGTEQIKELFGDISNSTVHKLKIRAREQMEKDGTAVFDKRSVDTDSAYKAWNLDIKAL